MHPAPVAGHLTRVPAIERQLLGNRADAVRDARTRCAAAGRNRGSEGAVHRNRPRPHWSGAGPAMSCPDHVIFQELPEGNRPAPVRRVQANGAVAFIDQARPRKCHDHAGTVLEKRDVALELGWHPEVIVIQQADVSASRRVQARVQRRWRAAMRVLENAQAGIANALHTRDGIVGGTVVQDEHFDVVHRLPERRVDGGCHKSTGVEGRNENADQRDVTRHARSSTGPGVFPAAAAPRAARHPQSR